MKKPTTAPKPRRRLAGLLALALAIPVSAVLALPWGLGTRTGRLWLLGKANAALAPGRLDLAGLSFSWFGPTRLTGLVLRNAKGEGVVAAPRATWDRNLGQILFRRPDLGTLHLDRPEIHAERSPDGSIDLYETLRPVIGKDPETSLRIEAPDGRLRFRGEGVGEPVVADHAAVSITIAPRPGPVTWRVRLAHGAPASTLEVVGRAEQTPPRVELRVTGHDWPWSVTKGGLTVAGRLDGESHAVKASGRWQSRGEATIRRFDAAGTGLAGDRVRVDRVQGVWDLGETDAGWSVRRLELDSPLVTLRAGGAAPVAGAGAAGVGEVTGRVDLAALAAQIPHALRLREGVSVETGTAEVRVATSRVEGVGVVDASAKVSDLRARDRGKPFTLRDPATLVARLKRPGGTVVVERLSAETPYLRAEARGDLTRGVTWTATLDLAGLQRQLRELVDFGAADLAGKGTLSGDYHADAGRFRGRLTGDLRGLRIAGVGPAPVERDAVAMEARFDGPAADNGLPNGWAEAHARLTSGGVAAEVTAHAEGPNVTAVVSGPVDLPERPARAEARVGARWDGASVRLDPVVLTLAPTDPGAGASTLRLAARGRFDRSRGELTLAPAGEAARTGGIDLGADGVRVSGLTGSGGLRVDVGLVGDVAALAPWLRSAPEALRGRWSARGSGRPADDGLHLAARLDVEGLAWGTDRDRDGEPVGLAVRALVPREGGRVDLSELVVKSRYATLDASGRVDDPGGRRLAELTGTLTPDWGVMNAWLTAHVEPGARVAGEPRAVRVKAPLDATWRDALDGEVGVSLTAAEVYGLKIGAAEIALRARAGGLTVEPIDTTVNGGKLHVEAKVRTGELGTAVVLGPGSSLTGVQVNDEVSRRVLSFVAPVLNNATRVRGRVSAEVTEAVFPVGGEAGRGTKVDGSVQFQDVEFVPGPATEQLFALFGRAEAPVWRLDAPVLLTIADRRVYQKGLSIPVGKISRVDLDGWVDFDRNLNVTASIPVLPSMLADRPLLGDIAGDARIRVPIRGTVQKPELDREAFDLALKDMGRSLLERGVGRGAAALLERMTRGRDPDAPPPITLKERRAERRRRRGLPP